jgi:hypothetical protein
MEEQDTLVLEKAKELVSSADSRVDEIWILSHAGSRAYGAALPTSDYDYKGVYRAPPIEDFFRQEVQHPFKIEPFDASMTAQVSFLKQLRKGSFTAVEVLWDENPLILHPQFKEVFYKNKRFLTDSLAKSYWGCFESYKDFITLNFDSEHLPTVAKLRKAIYHSFRNLEKIRMILKPDHFRLQSNYATSFREIREGKYEISELKIDLFEDFLFTQELYEKCSSELPSQVSLEELFELSEFMRH